MTKTGVPTAVSTTPPGCNVGGLAFTPLTPAQFDLVKLAWAHDKQVTVDYTEDPIAVVNVTGV